jgi:His-Xaa-Ser system radical SAM maturase HxsC
LRLAVRGTALGVRKPILGKLTTTAVPISERSDYIVFLKNGADRESLSDCEGYVGALSTHEWLDPRLPAIVNAHQLDYLEDGDVVLLLPSGTANVLYRRKSQHNTILATEQCNSLCLMCTQPPKEEDDSYRVKEILRLLELIDQGCQVLGISGGEPTLLGQNFIDILRKAKEYLPSTALHVLTNGRTFADIDFAAQVGNVAHPDLLLGIPLYSDIDEAHDYVVQANGAFDDTMRGFYNLAANGIAIELRVVIHALTYRRLPQLGRYIYRNLPFVSHIALMGMELFGFANQNFSELWIDPVEYAPQLEEATLELAMRGMPVSIFNHQLCTVPRSVWPFTRKSISDWKNVYLDACEACAVKSSCGGFFHSQGKRHSAHIRPLENPEPPAPQACSISQAK